MNPRAAPIAVVALCTAYLLGLGWAITNTTYDVWGVLVVIPPLGLLGVVVIRTMFDGPLRHLATILYVGLAMKLVGTALRYWVGFEAYQGGIDAQNYHDYAIIAATDVWAGRADLFSIFPGGTGTPATEGFAALVYTLTGTSKMSGFVVFGFLAFIGTLCFVKAACIAVPGLAQRRYAAFCVFAPSLVYWPSSIGKEALMLLMLGGASLGIAQMVSRPSIARSVVFTGVCLAGAAYIRPHLVGLWLAGAFPALLIMLLRGRSGPDERLDRLAHRALFVPVIVVAAIGLVVVSLATVNYLSPPADETGTTNESSVTAILDETTRRTVQAESSFDPPSISSPTSWPYASVRTLTRPLLVEARGAAQLFTALEMAIYLGLCAVSFRRLLHIPKMIITVPYVAFAMTTLFLGGLAFTSFANLAILARQRSLVVPFMVLILCVPPLARRALHDPEGADRPADETSVSQKSSMSPSVSAQFASGGSPRSLTARQVRTGPPPGRGANNDDVWG